MILIDGKKAAAELREELKKEVTELKNKYNKVPGLTVILIGFLINLFDISKKFWVIVAENKPTWIVFGIVLKIL